jgi:hypothetical protein
VRLNEAEDPAAGFGKEMPYHVPAGYFEQMYVQVRDRIEEGELAGDKQDPARLWRVPAAYFDELPNIVLTQAKKASRPMARLIRIGQQVNMRMAGIAVAAVLIIGFGLSIWRFQERGGRNEELFQASFSGSEISEYMQQNYIYPDTDYMAVNMDASQFKFDNRDIVQYLNENGWDGVE